MGTNKDNNDRPDLAAAREDGRKAGSCSVTILRLGSRVKAGHRLTSGERLEAAEAIEFLRGFWVRYPSVNTPLLLDLLDTYERKVLALQKEVLS